ncbi:methylamine utilization protein MauJ [Priestia megaterium]|uniref:methylamine utilization protein MauJ n=1 Tax=Priestia megaterium TaxID=1404 RepID=UPI000BFCBB7A|nr:methylamine utilization protein MauJ [Priestia megaterium]PGQ79687.1 hypothetical protein COA18_27945 [Priestia megaterium]
MATWEVELFVYGAVKVSKTIAFRTQKGTQGINPFFSDIEIKNFNEGIIINATAFAPTSNLAHSAALIFVGQMLDCLVLELDEPIPLFLSFDGKKFSSRPSNVRRFIEKREFSQAFDESLYLSINEPTFLKAYGWYRKGLYSEDPFDIFLALWNSLEIVTSKYHPRSERARNGTKSQMWESFKIIWGECENWPLIIRGDTEWIDRNYEVRKNIAHGIANVNIEQVEEVLSKIDTIRRVAHSFLKTWRHQQLFKDQHVQTD